MEHTLKRDRSEGSWNHHDHYEQGLDQMHTGHSDLVEMQDDDSRSESKWCNANG